MLYCLKIPLAQSFKDICTSQVLLAVIENYFDIIIINASNILLQ